MMGLMMGLMMRLRLRLMVGLRLRMGLGLLRHSSILATGNRAAFHGGRAVLVRYWLRGVRRPSLHRLPVSGSQLCVAFGLLVAALGSPLDGGRLLEGEVGAVGVGLGAAWPPLKGCRGLNAADVLLGVAPVSLGTSLAVALQTNTKYTLTENSYIRGKG